MPATAVEKASTYLPVPLEGLAGRQPLSFPLYLETAEHRWVLYRDTKAELDEVHVGRLHQEGVQRLFIRDADRGQYYRRVEGQLDDILKDKAVSLERRADVLHGVAVEMATDLLGQQPTHETVARAEKVLLSTSGLMLREKGSFQALRRLLRAGGDLANHSLTVSFLSMGLARHVLGAEPGTLLMAGLAGVLHDIGRVGYGNSESDLDHTRRGHDQLRRLGLPDEVGEAALYHHERLDGSGYPRGLCSTAIPEMARLVGLCDAFEKICGKHEPRVGVYDALRILAQAYRGCFEDRLAQGFVRLFRG